MDSTVRRILAPGERLMARQKIASKFMLLAVALLVPLAYVTWSFRNAKEYNVRIAVKEQHGDLYMAPAIKLFALEVNARSAAVQGNDLNGVRGELDAQVSQLDPIVAAHSAEFTNDKTWTAAKQSLAEAENATGSAAQVFEKWNAATTALYTDIQTVSGGSTLVLDPQLDTYNLMDSNTNRALSVMDSAGQAADYAAMTVRGQVARSQDEVIHLASLASNTTTPLSTIDAEYDGAYAFTKWGGLKGTIEPTRQALDTSSAALTDAVAQFVKTGKTTNFEALGADVREKASALVEKGIPALDHLLGTRLSGYRSQEHTVYLVFVVFTIAAAYLFVAMLLSVKGAIKQVLTALEAAAEGDFTVTAKVDTRDEIGATADAVDHMQTQIKEAVGAIATSASSLAGASEELSVTSTTMSETSSRAAAGANSASAAAEQVSANMSTVAAAIEEMSSSIGEIAMNSTNAATVAVSAASTAAATSDIVGRLHESSAQISNVVAMITSIAEQTNLLALNATIEAARAGDAGKGFAVVANEVKDLAQQTANATATITAQVEGIQTDTNDAVQAIAELANVIGQINETQASIAAAVEEQTVTTNEIGGNVSEAATGTNEIARAVTEVASTTRANSEGAEQTHGAAGELSRLANDLETLVRRFQY